MGGNKGKWNEFYKDLDAPEPYIHSVSYGLGAEWLAKCEVVEDWGCGKGWFAHLHPDLNVVSVDGSWSKFADKVVDLEDYKSDVDGIFMRSVAEHNYEWKKILSNLLGSFKKRAFVQFYTPMNYSSDEGILLTTSPGYDNIPEISIPVSIWHGMIEDAGIKYKAEKIDSPLAYGEETLYRLEK